MQFRDSGVSLRYVYSDAGSVPPISIAPPYSKLSGRPTGTLDRLAFTTPQVYNNLEFSLIYWCIAGSG